MAAPRVFVSSTYYDLRHVRADLERFIRDQGFEPVLHERGSIAYGAEEGLEEYAYREVELCDILVSVVGGRFGTKSRRDDKSISQNEVKTALKGGKQVYIFIERSVLNEYRLWEQNRDNATIKWTSADSPKIYEFISELYALPNNNPIEPFDNASEIGLYLQRQWAGLFQRLLRTSTAVEQHQSIEKLTQAVTTLERLVDLMAQTQHSRSDVVDSILLLEHPVFRAIRNALSIPFRVSFYTLDELVELASAYRFEDYDDPDSEHYHQWVRSLRPTASSQKAKRQYLMVSKRLFRSNGTLLPVNPGDWQDSDVRVHIQDPNVSPFDRDDDDLPF